MPYSSPERPTDRLPSLKRIREKLGRHHFGIDKEIQRLMDAFAPWHLFPGTQTRPRTIGLWGMTGTGKSSLVRNMVRELELEDITFWLDAGECHAHDWMDQLFGRLEEHFNGGQFIVVVDEFQQARTGGMAKPEPTELRRFWEFLDAGRVVTWPHIHAITELYDLQDRLSNAIEAGVRIENGLVVRARERFETLVQRHYRRFERKGPWWAIPVGVWDDLRSLFPEPRPSLPAIEKMISGLDGPGSIAFLQRLRTAAQRPNVVDARQALVILLGNLDELYVTGKEPTAEVDPDVLLRRHKDIGATGVHKALLHLFRIEQVARMGNDHVIFPPLGKTTIDRLIGHEVDALVERLSISCGKRLLIDPPIVDRIKSVPTPAVLGARPVIEAVQRVLPLLFSQALQQCSRKCDSIRLSLGNDRPMAIIRCGAKEKAIMLQWPEGLFSECSRLPEELLRYAVHEAGHLICGMVLCGLRPLQACARTTDPEIRGFVIWEEQQGVFMTRDRIVPELARLLGGLAAEQLRYGRENISSGSGADLRSATEIALTLAKNSGLGPDRLYHAHHPSSEHGGYRTGLAAAEDQVREWMQEAESLAFATIEEHARTFNALVDALMEKGSLGMSEMEMLFPKEKSHTAAV